jgi:MFS family permease
MQARQENVFVVALRVLREQPMLAVMMFLQYAIWGAWAVGLSGYLDKMGYTGKAVSLIYNAIPIMSLIVPFTAGQIADRFMPASGAGVVSLAGWHPAAAIGLSESRCCRWWC